MALTWELFIQDPRFSRLTPSQQFDAAEAFFDSKARGVLEADAPEYKEQKAKFLAAVAPTLKTPRQQEVEGMGAAERLGRGALAGIQDVGIGALQIGNKLNQALSVPGSAERGKDIQNLIAKTRTENEPLYQTGAGTAGRILPAFAAPGTAIGAAIYAGSLPAMTERERLQNMLTGGIIGGGANLLVKGLKSVSNRIGAPIYGGSLKTPGDIERHKAWQKIIDDLESRGFKITAGMRSKNELIEGIESQFPQILGTSGRAKALEGANRARLNRIAGSTIGSTKSIIDDSVISSAAARIGRTIETAIPSGTKLMPTSALTQKLDEILGKLESGLPSRRNQPAIDALNDVKSAISSSSGIGRKQYQEIMSDLSGLNRQLYVAGERKASMRIGEVEKALNERMEDFLKNTAPDAFAKFQKARGEWGNLRILEESVDQAGDLNVRALMRAIARHRKRELVAREGRTKSELTLLAKYGPALGKVVPDSGTPLRTASRTLLTNPRGAAEVSGLSPTGYLLGLAGRLGLQNALYNPDFAKYVSRVPGPSGPFARSLEEILPRSLVGATFAGLDTAQ